MRRTRLRPPLVRAFETRSGLLRPHRHPVALAPSPDTGRVSALREMPRGAVTLGVWLVRRADDSGPEADLEYHPDAEPVNIVVRTGNRPNHIQQLASYHRAFRDLAVHPIAVALARHLIGEARNLPPTLPLHRRRTGRRGARPGVGSCRPRHSACRRRGWPCRAGRCCPGRRSPRLGRRPPRRPTRRPSRHPEPPARRNRRGPASPPSARRR